MIMNIDVRKSSLVVGRRTHINILEGRKIRKDEYGGDCFEDYWTDSGEESSHTSVSSKRERLKKSTNLSLSEAESDLYDSDNDELDKSKDAKEILKKTFPKSAVRPELEKYGINDAEEDSLATTIDNSESSQLKKKKRNSSDQLPVKSKMNDSVVTRNMIRKQQNEKKYVKEVLEKENYSPLNAVNDFNKTGTSFHNEAPPKSDKMSNTRNFRSKVSQFLNRVAHKDLASSTSRSPSPLSKTYDKKRDISVSPHVVSKRRNYIRKNDLQEDFRMQNLRDNDNDLLAMKSVSPLSKTFDLDKNAFVSKCVHTEKKTSVVSPMKSPVQNVALVKPLKKHQRKTKGALEMEKIISNYDEYDALILQMSNENHESSRKKNSILEVDHSNVENILSNVDETRLINEKTKNMDKTVRKLDFTKTIKESSRNLLDQTKENSLGNDIDENTSSSESLLKENSKNDSSHVYQSKRNLRILKHRVAANASEDLSEREISLHNSDNLPSPQKMYFSPKSKEGKDYNVEIVHSSSCKDVASNSPAKSKNVSEDMKGKDFSNKMDEIIEKKKGVKNNVQDNNSQTDQSSLMPISPKKHNSDHLSLPKENVRHKKKHSSTNSKEAKDSNDAHRVHRSSRKEFKLNSPAKSINVSKDIEDNVFSNDRNESMEKNKSVKNKENNVQDKNSQTGQSSLISISPKKHTSDHLPLPKENVRSKKEYSSTNSKETKDSNDANRVHRSSRKEFESNSPAKSINVSEDIEDNDFSDSADESIRKNKRVKNVQEKSSQAGQSSLMSIPLKTHSDHLSLPEKSVGHKKMHSSTKSKESEDSNDAKRVHRSRCEEGALNSPVKSTNVSEDSEDNEFSDNIDKRIEKNRSVENIVQGASSQVVHLPLPPKKIRHEKKHSFSKSKDDEDSNDAKRVRRSTRHQVALNSSAESINVFENTEGNDFRNNIDEIIEKNKSVANNGQGTSSQLKQSILMSISQEKHYSSHLSSSKKNVRSKKKHTSTKTKAAEYSNDAKRVHRSGRHQIASNSSTESMNVSGNVEDNDFKDNTDEKNETVENNGQDTGSQLKQSSLMPISPKKHHSNHLSLPKKNVRHKKKHSYTMPKETENSNDAKRVRRSGRQRYAPLAHWRNERLCYRFENGDIQILGIDKGTREDDLASQQIMTIINKRQIYFKKQLKTPKIKKIHLHDTVNDRKVHVKLFKPFRSVKWSTPASAPEASPYRIKRTFETQNSAFGFLEIDISEIKPPQYMPEEDLQMTLMKGHVEVIIQESSFEVMEKDMFIVPRGSAYSIKNIGNVKAFLTFVVGKFKFLESQD